MGVPNSWSVVGQRDFNGDGKTDLLWRNTNGDLAIWLMNGTQVSSGVDLGNVPTSWTVAGTGDFNGDGKGDILWRDTSGNVAIWLMNGTSIRRRRFSAWWPPAGPSSAPATSTATARPTFSGATPTATWRSG